MKQRELKKKCLSGKENFVEFLTKDQGSDFIRTIRNKKKREEQLLAVNQMNLTTHNPKKN